MFEQSGMFDFVPETEFSVLQHRRLFLHEERSEAIASLALELATGEINVDSPGINPLPGHRKPCDHEV